MKFAYLIGAISIISASAHGQLLKGSTGSSLIPEPKRQVAQPLPPPQSPPQVTILPATQPLRVYAPPGIEVIDNNQVVAMVQAGLGPEAVVAKINSTRGQYDTSTTSMIQLKRAGVPDSVIAAMLVRSNSRTLSNSVADNSSPDPMAPHTPGIYLLDPSNGGRMMRIDPTVSNQTKTSNVLGFAFSYGLSSMKLKSVIPNAQARVHAPTRNPTFYFYFNQSSQMASMSEFGSSFAFASTSPNEFSLVRFEQKKDHREASIGSYNLGGAKTGVSDKARVPFTYDDVAPGVFVVRPQVELSQGQYGFVYSMGGGTGVVSRIFDFAIN